MPHGRAFTKPVPPQDALEALFEYRVETGALIYKTRPVEMFATIKAQRRWNAMFVGKEAGAHNADGYKYVRLGGLSFLTHRIIWALVFGSIPTDKSIDHVNGDRKDNRIVNLSLVGHRANMTNRRLSKNNVSGHHGVHFDKRRGTWVARIREGGRYSYLGEFKDKELAVAARERAETRLHFHSNHGL